MPLQEPVGAAAHPVRTDGCRRFRLCGQSGDQLPTIHEEILADYSAVARLQQAIEAGADLETINNLKKEAVEEIERTVARYARDRKDG